MAEEPPCPLCTCNQPVYGPVKSWRYGRSLGIDLLPGLSTCNFDCVYCQLGRIANHRTHPGLFVHTDEVLRAFDSVDQIQVDTITVSGNGEPTLAQNLGPVLAGLRARTRLPLVVLTNATRLEDYAVRGALSFADVVECKLDAVSSRLFTRVNRPVEGISAASIVSGIRQLRRDLRFRGKLAIQIMLLPMSLEDLNHIADVVAGIGVDEVHLNQPRRAVPRVASRDMRGAHDQSDRIEGVHLKSVDPDDADTARDLFTRLCHCPVMLAPG